MKRTWPVHRRRWQPLRSAINLAPVPEFQHEHEKFNVIYVIHDSIITHSNTKLSCTPNKLDTARWARIFSKCGDGVSESFAIRRMDTPEDLSSLARY